MGVLTCMLAALAGCAALPWPAPRLPATGSGRDTSGWLDLRGIVHVHTRGSHDSPGRLEDAIRAARHVGADWIAITEHRRLGLHPRVRESGGVLVLPGFEIRAVGGSILAIGCPLLPPRRLRPPEIVRFVHESGGVAFVGHFEKSRLADPAAFAAAAPDGVEIVNLHARANRGRLRTTLRMLVLPRPWAWRALVRGGEPNLDRWAALPGARAVVGGVDAHAKLGVAGGLLRVDPYEAPFGLVTTHVWARARTERAILEALRAGRSYVAMEGLAPVPWFRFARKDAGFVIEAPRAARLRLRCDAGTEAAGAPAERAVLKPPPGTRWCHAEAWLGRDLWVVTSRMDVPATEGAGHAAPGGRP